FLNTVRQIVSSDGVSPVRGVLSHLRWQLRRVTRAFPCELKIGNSRLYVDRPGGVAALVNAMGEYDFNNMELLRLVLMQRPSTFIDVGANVGTYTLIASEVPYSEVVSIEPHPSTFALLRNNVARNDRGNVLCLNVGLSHSDSDLLLSEEEDPSLNRAVGEGLQRDRVQIVTGRTLQSLCEQFDLFPDFVKVDVEGYERSVLQGFGKYRGAPDLIFIEGGDRVEIEEWMRDSGYRGPWFVHMKSRVISTVHQRRVEDPVFVHERYISEMEALKFRFTGALSRGESECRNYTSR
ncbi:MAG: FkbM family methyltransferase, partial [Candidatus Acidiferrales bacterium]